jgi:hypothetical protein
VYGRLPLYHGCGLLFIVFTVLAAVSTDMSMFIAFRFLMGCKFFTRMVLSTRKRFLTSKQAWELHQWSLEAAQSLI